jgi:hypothetical protein
VIARRVDFEHGLVVGGIVGLAGLLLLYAVAAPTNDYRERVVFLLAANGGRFALVLSGVLAILGGLLLMLTGPVTRDGCLGIVVSAASLTLTAEASLLHRVIPEIPDVYPRWVIAIAVVVASTGALLWERRAHSARLKARLDLP